MLLYQKIKTVFVFILGLSLGYIILNWFSQSTPSNAINRSFPSSPSCTSLKAVEFSFTSKIILPKKLGEHYNIKAEPQKLVKDQLNYVKGYFHFLEDTDYVFLPEQFRVVSLSPLEETTLKKQIKIVPKDIFDQSFLPENYTKGINLNEKTESYKLNYKAHVSGSLCLKNSRVDLAQIEFKIPVTPYLIYWEIANKKEVQLSFQNETALLPPCISPRYVLEKKPEHYWYFWKPKHKSKELNFDCSDLLVEEENTLTFKSKLIYTSSKNIPQNFDQLLNKKEIRMDLFFGFINYKENAKENMLKNLKKHNLINEKEVSYKELNFKSYFSEDLDIASKASLDLINSIASKFSPKATIKLEDDPAFLKFKINEKSSSSQRISINLYLMDTSYKNRDKFYFQISESFKNADIIFYNGHSAHGDNLSFENLNNYLLFQKKSLKELLKNKQYQLFGNLSCFSTSYETNNYFNYRPKDKNYTTDQIRTGSEGYIVFLPLSLIDLILQKNRYLDLKQYSTPEELVIFDREIQN